MKIKYFCFLLLSLLSGCNAQSTCGNSPNTNYYISNNLELENIKNCNIINGSLVINSGYDINSLESLSNLNEVTGNLVILDNHALTNLKGLHNLNKIHGQDLYLNQYGLVIKHNNNNINDNNHGLCFSETVNWNSILQNGNKLIIDNGVGCINCDPECNGCFGPGVLLCQNCNNFYSGDACVNECFNNNYGANNTCLQSIPASPSINLNVLNDTSIYIEWNETTNSGGFITLYELYQNDSLIYSTKYDDDGYNLKTFVTEYYSNNLQPSTIYRYHIQAYNSFGTNLKIYYEAKTEAAPTPEPTMSPTKNPTESPTASPTVTPTLQYPNNIHINNITSHSFVLHWNQYQGTNVRYNYKITGNNLLDENITYHNHVIIENLNPFNTYSYRVKTVNDYQESEYSALNNVTTLESIPGKMNAPILEYYNQTVLVVNFTDPIKNGIITKYEIRIEDEHGFVFNYDFTVNILNPNMVILNDLLPNGLYLVDIRAYTSIGPGEYSLPSSIQMPIGKPPKPIVPSILTGTITDNSIKLNLVKVSNIYGNITKYILNIYNNNNITSITLDDFDTTVEVKNLEKDNTYSFTLTACTNTVLCSTSQLSNEVLIKKQNINRSSDSSDNKLGLYEILGISIGSVLFIILLIFGFYKYKKYQDNKNRERLSRLQGRVVTRNNLTNNPPLSFQNPMYNDTKRERENLSDISDDDMENITSTTRSEVSQNNDASYLSDIDSQSDEVFVNYSIPHSTNKSKFSTRVSPIIDNDYN